jgi:hypothetical protein
MADAFKCDRCRTFQEGVCELTLVACVWGKSDDEHELCDQCRDSFSAWFLQACPVDCARNKTDG